MQPYQLVTSIAYSREIAEHGGHCAYSLKVDVMAGLMTAVYVYAHVSVGTLE